MHYGLGYTDNFSYNVANIFGIGLATLFRLYCYRRWVFLMADDDAPLPEQLEPETSGRLSHGQPRTADRSRGALSAASSWSWVR